MTNGERPVTAGHPREQKNWFSESLVSRLLERHTLQDTQAGLEYFQKKRVLDFAIHGGRIAAKIQNEGARPYRAILTVEQLSDESWDRLLEVSAKQAVFMARLLAGYLPKEISSAFESAGVPFLTDQVAAIGFSCDCSDDPVPCRHTAALCYRLGEALDSDPFVFFSLLGRGREELLFQLRKLREGLKQKLSPSTDAAHQPLVPENLQHILDAPEHFWLAPKGVFEITYSIRADELPAGILRRLDPIPIGGYEDEVEFHLEDAYAQVARRAQVYGLGLRTPSRSGTPHGS